MKTIKLKYIITYIVLMGLITGFSITDKEPKYSKTPKTNLIDESKKIFETDNGGLLNLNNSTPKYIDNFDGANDTSSLKARGYKIYYRGSNIQGTSATWFQGYAPVFPSFNGPSSGYVVANYSVIVNSGNIDSWMVLPKNNISNGDSLIFYSRSPTGSTYPDSLRVMYSAAGDSVPEATWIELGRFKVNTSGSWERKAFGAPIAGTNARFAIRYNVVNGGPLGTNSDYVGIDAMTIEAPPIDTNIYVNSNVWPVGDIPLNPGNMAPKASISNSGPDNISVPFPITYQISGPINYTSTKNITLEAGTVKTIIFDSTFNPSDSGVYTVKIFMGGGVGSGDTLQSQFSVWSPPDPHHDIGVLSFSLEPDGLCCFKVIFYTTFTNYNSFRITPASPNTITSASPVNSSTVPAFFPPEVSSVIWKSPSGTNFSQGPSYLGTICFNNASNNFQVNIQYSTNNGSTFGDYTKTLNLHCPNQFSSICEDFNNGSMGNWRSIASNTSISSPGPSGDDNYFRTVDGSGFSYIYNNVTYNGDWRQYDGKCFCWDYKIFDDGISGSHTAIRPKIKIFSNLDPSLQVVTGTNPRLQAEFTANFTVTEVDGWVHICAPINICGSGGALPGNNQGQWQTYPNNNSCSDWNELLSNIGSIFYFVDFTGNTQNEAVGFDNICIENCEVNRCDQISAWGGNIANNTNGDCCWQVDLTHSSDMSGISKIQFLTTGSSTFSSFDLNNAFSSWINFSNTSTSKIFGPADGIMPVTSLHEFANFCLNNSVSNPKRVIVNWLSASNEILCDDTLELYCDVPCMNITSNTVQCLSDSSYSVKFNFTNNSNFTMKTLQMSPVTPSNVVISPSSVILNPQIAPNGNATNVSLVLSNVSAPSHVCIAIKAISSDNCCWCYDTLCIDIPVCVCENLSSNLVANSTSGGCDYTLNLINNYSANYFTGIQTEIITSGVTFKTESAGLGWGFDPVSSPVMWFPVPITKLPTGAINGKINFTLTGYTTTPQKMVLRWMRGIAKDTVVCIDTLILNCQPPYPVTDTCSQLIVVSSQCYYGFPFSTGRKFKYKFKIQNNSGFDATGFMITGISPTGAVISPADFPTTAINQNSISSEKTMFISNVNENQQVCFKIALYRQYTDNGNPYSECCHTDTICINTPTCGTIFSTFNGPFSIHLETEALTTLDTFKIIMRESTFPFTIIDSTTLFSQLSNQKHKLNALFNTLDSGSSYYIVIKHRNSIETWSANPVLLIGDSITYDFTTSASNAFGNNMILVNGKWCFYSGDVNQDGLVDIADIVSCYNASATFLTGYVDTDLNGDGLVDIGDIVVAYNNSVKFIQVMRP